VIYFAFMRRTLRGIVACALVALIVPVASASAATKKAKAPKIVKGEMSLFLPDAYFVNGKALMTPNRTLHVHGVVHPYVANQWATVQAYVGTKLIKSVNLRIKPANHGRYGQFTYGFTTSEIGQVTVNGTHTRSKRMYRFGTQRHYSVLDENVGFGSTGLFVELMQQRLAALHFYIPQTGVYDQGMGLALDAYHRLLGWGVSQSLDANTIRYLLNGWGAFKVRYPSQGRHAEGDLADQVLALINGSKVYALYPISSGKPSTPTVLGEFSVYRKTPGYLPDGMYYSNFFTGGYAIHGYNPAPDYPASHGCMRVPIVDAISIYNWLEIGNDVDTYY
jgi:L,D-transpeptidase catalytic domain